MTYLSVNIKQSNQERQEQEQTNQEYVLDTDRYSEGYFEGYIGAEPTQPEQHSYWYGYQIGFLERWLYLGETPRPPRSAVENTGRKN
jgi:hypothetical protein